ncbi:MAG TPA: cytochrome c biogenesis protein CcsA [Geobacteraceae bacterium]
MLDTALIWFCIYCYAVATILLLTGFVFSKNKLLKIAGFLVLPAFLAHTTLFGMRWVRTGWFPANGELENALTAGWFAIAFTVYLFARNRSTSGVALFTVPATLLLMGYGVMKAPSPLPMEASLKSSWLLIHVLFAQLAFGSYLLVSGFGLLYVLKDRRIRSENAIGFYGRFPALEIIDELMFKFVIYGFIAQAIMIVSGSIWAKELWGSYWGWDPVEVWALVSWLLYGLSIHLRVTLGWRGRRLAWLMIFLLSTVIISYWGINIVVENSKHIFGVVS